MHKTKPDLFANPVVDGKFIKFGSERFYIKGVTYGTFQPDDSGDHFPAAHIMEHDLSLMSENGINSIRTYTVPSRVLLDLALKYGLKVMIGLPWEQHLTFLDKWGNGRKIIHRIVEQVTQCHGHPAILCYSLGNEIPANMVRWYGESKISRFLKKIFYAIKMVDTNALVTYVNYPTTEYLNLPFLDLYCFNVYLESKEKLSSYLSRLHNLAGDKPLILAEIGIDSFRHGLEGQASMLDWQVSTAFERGCAGTFVFSWTDEWWRGGASIDDWDFGLVDRARNPKPALSAVQNIYNHVPGLRNTKLPSFSVVICSHNGSGTIRDTLEACSRLDYPDYEIIVVNDGSTDPTAEIAREYKVKLISTENHGLSSARNRGIMEASGDIIAFTDDDAWPDSQWLKYLAVGYMTSDFAGIGGPNIAPGNDGFIAHCVANAPGRPVHVLTTDEIAEHIPGCNMSFKRDILLKTGGFDPVFRTAGDDVDICWRIQELGFKIGFHPSAYVWHHCRNSVRMYWKQQKGYGKAEALLEQKWPERYNFFGHLTWNGYIYGNGLTKSLKINKKRIFYGTQGSALFQSVYQPCIKTLSSIPLMPEWYFLILFLALVSLLGIEWHPLFWSIPFFIVTILVVITQSVESASYASFNPHFSCFKRWVLYFLTTVLHLLQPIARLKGRINNGLTLWKTGYGHLNHLGALMRVPGILNHWSESPQSAADWLKKIQQNLESMYNKCEKGGEFDRWDLKNQTGVFASVRSILTIEEHGMGKQMVKLRKNTVLSKYALIAIAISITISILAIHAHAYISFCFFLLTSLILTVKLLADISGAVYSIWSVLQTLPSGIKNKEMSEE